MRIIWLGLATCPSIIISSIKQSAFTEENSYQMGIETAQLIFKNINEHETEEKGTPHHIYVPCKLIIHR